MLTLMNVLGCRKPSRCRLLITSDPSGCSTTHTLFTRTGKHTHTHSLSGTSYFSLVMCHVICVQLSGSGTDVGSTRHLGWCWCFAMYVLCFHAYLFFMALCSRPLSAVCVWAVGGSTELVSPCLAPEYSGSWEYAEVVYTVRGQKAGEQRCRWPLSVSFCELWCAARVLLFQVSRCTRRAWPEWRSSSTRSCWRCLKLNSRTSSRSVISTTELSTSLCSVR